MRDDEKYQDYMESWIEVAAIVQNLPVEEVKK